MSEERAGYSRTAYLLALALKAKALRNLNRHEEAASVEALIEVNKEAD